MTSLLYGNRPGVRKKDICEHRTLSVTVRILPSSNILSQIYEMKPRDASTLYNKCQKTTLRVFLIEIIDFKNIMRIV